MGSSRRYVLYFSVEKVKYGRKLGNAKCSYRFLPVSSSNLSVTRLNRLAFLGLYSESFLRVFSFPPLVNIT